MYYIVGDIGNTSTKVCILNNKFKIVRSFNFETIMIFKKNFLKKTIKDHFNKNLNSNLLFSSVVPKYSFLLKKFLKKFYKIKFKEIKDKKINRIVKINIKNKS